MIIIRSHKNDHGNDDENINNNNNNNNKIIMIIINSIFQPGVFSAVSTTESINIIKKGSILNHMK